MPTFRYRALTEGGEAVTGSLDASSLAEVNRRIEYLGLIPIEAATARSEITISRAGFSFGAPRPEDVTTFTADLALLLRAGQRINDALELLAGDTDLGRMRPTVTGLAGSVLSGHSFGEAVSMHPRIFSPIYVALIRVGETSGALVTILEALMSERQRAEALSRRLSDALRYPAFLLFAAGAVLTFFLTFVLPQFGNMFHDFNAKPDWVLALFLDAFRVPAIEWPSDSGYSAARRRRSMDLIAAVVAAKPIVRALGRLPVLRPIWSIGAQVSFVVISV